MSQFSLNNRLVVEAYKPEGLKSSVNNGFATIAQKVSLKPLTVLIDAKVMHGDTMIWIPAGSKAYVREEMLHTQPWAKKILECDTIPQNFIIVDLQYVEFIAPPEGDVA